MIGLLIAEAPMPDARWRGQRRQGGGDVADDALLDLRFGLADKPAAGFAWHGECTLGEDGDPDPAAVLLFNFCGIEPNAEEEFNAWYDTEHVPRLAALPGVQRVRRYRSSEHDPAYLAFYEIDAPQVAQGDAWLTAARTPWTMRMKQFTRGYRSYLFEPLP